MFGPLSKLNRGCKASSPRISSPISVRRQYGSVQICVTTEGCLRGRSGSCTICNYGCGTLPSAEELRGALRHVLDPLPEGTTSVLFGACGSVFDSDELSEDLLDVVLEAAASLPEDVRLIFETAYTTVDDGILRRLERVLGGRRVDIELGLESVDAEVLGYSLNKSVDPEEFESCIRMIHAHGFECTVNIVVGAPFLTSGEQIHDAASSVAWADGAGADTIVLFPVNVKPGTALWELRSWGAYETVPLMRLVETLGDIGPGTLSKVVLSWAEDSPEFGFDGTLYPTTCDRCRDAYGMLGEFMSETDGGVRSAMVSNYLETHRCGCRSMTPPRPHDPGAVEWRARSWLSPRMPPFVPMAVRGDADLMMGKVSETMRAGLRGFGIVSSPLSDRDAVALHIYERMIGDSKPVVINLHGGHIPTSAGDRDIAPGSAVLVLGAEEDDPLLRRCIGDPDVGFVLFTSSHEVDEPSVHHLHLAPLDPDESSATVSRYSGREPWAHSEWMPSLEHEMSDPGYLWMVCSEAVCMPSSDGSLPGTPMDLIEGFDRFDECGLTSLVRNEDRMLMSRGRDEGERCIRILDFLSLNVTGVPITRDLTDLVAGEESSGLLDILSGMSMLDYDESVPFHVRLGAVMARARRRVIERDGRMARVLSEAYAAIMRMRWMDSGSKGAAIRHNGRFLSEFAGMIPVEGDEAAEFRNRIMSSHGLLMLTEGEIGSLIAGGACAPERFRHIVGGQSLWEEARSGVRAVLRASVDGVPEGLARRLSLLQTGIPVEFRGEAGLGTFDPYLRYIQFLYDAHVIDSALSYAIGSLAGLFDHTVVDDDPSWAVRLSSNVSVQMLGLASRDSDPRYAAITARVRGYIDRLAPASSSRFTDVDPDDAERFQNTLVLFRAYMAIAELEDPTGGSMGRAIDGFFGEGEAERLCSDPCGPVSTRSIFWRVPVYKGSVPPYLLNIVYRHYAELVADHDLRRALVLFDLSDRAFGVWGNDLGQAGLRLSWSRALRAAGDLDDAYAKAMEASEMAEGSGAVRILAESLLEIASMDAYRGDLRKAWGNVSRIERAVPEDAMNDRIRASLEHLRADLLFLEGDLGRSLESYERAVGLYDPTDAEGIVATSMVYRLRNLLNLNDGGCSNRLMTYVRSVGSSGVPEGLKFNILNSGSATSNRDGGRRGDRHVGNRG